MTGRIHSIETMGTVDGPGMRMVVFLRGKSEARERPMAWQGWQTTLQTAGYELRFPITKCAESAWGHRPARCTACQTKAEA